MPIPLPPSSTARALPPHRREGVEALTTGALYDRLTETLLELRRRGENAVGRPLRQRLVDELAEMHMERVSIDDHHAKRSQPQRGFRRSAADPVRMDASHHGKGE